MNDQGILTLCFHGIGEPGREPEPGEEGYWIERGQFLRILDAIDQWPQTRITFDDGNASDHEIGLPALRERGLTATFFVLAGRLDTPGSVSSAAVADLCHAGMSIGTHGMDHRPWRGMDATIRQRELVEARAVIAEAAGVPVDEAACPLGEYDHQLLVSLRELGYTRVHTSDHLVSRPRDWLRPRFSVLRTDTVETLSSRVSTSRSFPLNLRNRVVSQFKRCR
jgi:peptidoglycan/xylan/chitin deacetylase (PgdA/CDA1 family)